MDQKTDIVIVGAGIVGGALARELARDGMRVLLLDRQRPAAEATWAAAGMLAATPEVADSDEMIRLSRASLGLYPTFVEEIEAESGIHVGMRQNGALLAFFGSHENQKQAEHQSMLARLGLACQTLTGEQARQREPALNPAVTSGLWLPDEGTLDNRTLGRAVILAAQRRGAVLRSGIEVSGLLLDGSRCRGVLAAGETISASHVVIAAGCYSGQIEGVGRYAPTRPVRGQMVSLDGGTARPVTAIRSERGYVVPREDGRVLAGSTVENAGFDKSVTPRGLRSILDAAVELVPSLDGVPVLETWSGLRPDTPDHLPILGPTEIEGLSIATGHFRNGILLAPITARLARQWLLGQKTDLPLDAFSPLRFAQSARTNATP